MYNTIEATAGTAKAEPEVPMLVNQATKITAEIQSLTETLITRLGPVMAYENQATPGDQSKAPRLTQSQLGGMLSEHFQQLWLIRKNLEAALGRLQI